MITISGILQNIVLIGIQHIKYHYGGCGKRRHISRNIFFHIYQKIIQLNFIFDISVKFLCLQFFFQISLLSPIWQELNSVARSKVQTIVFHILITMDVKIVMKITLMMMMMMMMMMTTMIMRIFMRITMMISMPIMMMLWQLCLKEFICKKRTLFIGDWREWYWTSDRFIGRP